MNRRRAIENVGTFLAAIAVIAARVSGVSVWVVLAAIWCTAVGVGLVAACRWWLLRRDQRKAAGR